MNISKKIRKTVMNLNPDIVYCEALFDLLIKELGVLKRKNNNMKLIFDVCEYSDSLHQKYLVRRMLYFVVMNCIGGTFLGLHCYIQ